MHTPLLGDCLTLSADPIGPGRTAELRPCPGARTHSPRQAAIQHTSKTLRGFALKDVLELRLARPFVNAGAVALLDRIRKKYRTTLILVLPHP